MKDTSSWLSIYCCSHAYRNCSLLDWVRFIYVSSLSSGSKLTFQYLHPEVHTIESLKQLRLMFNLIPHLILLWISRSNPPLFAKFLHARYHEHKVTKSQSITHTHTHYGCHGTCDWPLVSAVDSFVSSTVHLQHSTKKKLPYDEVRRCKMAARSLTRNLPYFCMRMFFAVNPCAILYVFLD